MEWLLLRWSIFIAPRSSRSTAHRPPSRRSGAGPGSDKLPASPAMARKRSIPLQISGKMHAAMHHFSDIRLRRVVRTLLERAGSEPAEAAQVADHLVDANLRGHDSHGIGMIPHYVHNITNQTMCPNTALSVVKDGGAVMLFDGGLGFGQRVGVEMMERLIERARAHGAVVASLRNVHHLGRIGAYAEMAVAARLVSIHFVNVTGHPPLVAPYRGSHARFGTNPICIGVPGTSRHEPFLLDMATSVIALGKVRVALNKGERITAGTLVDARGQPTTDPKVMFPDDEALNAGRSCRSRLHKGYGLLFAAELLAGVVGSGGTSNPGTADLDTIRNNMLTVVIDPASLAEPQWMEGEFDTIVDYVTSSPPANPEEPVLVAGDPERMTMEKRLAEGVPVDPVTWEGILEAGEVVGLPRSEASALVSNV